MRKPPIKFGASPSEDDENGRILARKLEESRRQTSPGQKASPAPVKKPKALRTQKPQTPKRDNKVGETRSSEVISIRVSVTNPVEEKTAIKAEILGVDLDYLKLTLIERTRKLVGGDFNAAKSGIERKVADYTLHYPKSPNTWARITLTLPAGTIAKLRALTKDKLEIHKKSTLARALFLAALEKTLEDL